jgi:putative hydrolase of the HAD superfamily
VSKKPDIIAIDLDNTMYVYNPCHEAGMTAVSAELKNRLDLSETQWLHAYDSSRQNVKARLGKIASSHSRLAYFKGMLENLGIPTQLELALQLEALYWGSFIRNMRKADNLDQFLAVAREKGIPVVVVTDLTTGIQIKKIHTLGIADMISGLVSSEDVGADKPDATFKDYINQQLRLDGHHWWVVGDDISKDKGFAEALLSAEFMHVSADGVSATNFTKLSKALETISN